MSGEVFTLYNNGETDFLEFGIELFENGKRVAVNSARGQEMLKMREIKDQISRQKPSNVV